jgi:hypothetical protein
MDYWKSKIGVTNYFPLALSKLNPETEEELTEAFAPTSRRIFGDR